MTEPQGASRKEQDPMTKSGSTRRAVVLGGAGHLGSAVVRELVVRGYRVTAVRRHPGPAANLAGVAVDLASGDAGDPGRLDAWVRGCELVVDAAAPYPLAAFGNGDRVALAVERTRSILAAVERHGARLALISSFTTLPGGPGGLGGLGARVMRRLHPYFAVKDAVEAEVRSALDAGLPAVVVHPTLCLGPWDLKPRELCFVPQLLAGEIPAVLDHLINVVDVREVATALVGALEQERWAEPVRVAGHNVTLDALCRWICDLEAVKPPSWRAPSDLFVAPALAAEALASLFDRPGTGPGRWPSLVLMLLAQHHWQTPSTAQIDLGAAPRSLSATLVDSIEWYRGLEYC